MGKTEEVVGGSASLEGKSKKPRNSNIVVSFESSYNFD